MLVIKLLAASIVLGGIGYILRTPPKGRVRGGAGFVAGFVLMAFGTSQFAGHMGIVRNDAYAAIAADALQKINANSEPYLLLVGASYSRNAINDAQLTKELAERNYGLQAINFSLEGASLQERDLRLRQLLKAVSRPPAIVLLEISERFDSQPTYGFKIAKFSERVFGQFTLKNTSWTAQGLLEKRKQLGLKQVLKDSVLLAAHVPVNLTGAGLFASGDRLQDIAPNPSYDPQSTPRSKIDAIRRNHGLLAPFTDPVPLASNWAGRLRKSQSAWLQEQGVGKVGYYFPPVIDPSERHYVNAICLDYELCISPQNLPLLARLDKAVWFDDEHLLANGAKIYTSWLADQLDTRGAFKNVHPNRQLATKQPVRPGP